MRFTSLCGFDRKRLHALKFMAASIIAFILGTATTSAFATEPTGSMSVARYAHKAAALSDGRVLVAGGYTNSGLITATTEIYDPSTGLFSQTGSLLTARSSHALAKLPDGRILAVGGASTSAGNSINLNSAEIYDSYTGSWMPTGSMNVARRIPAALALPDGRILVVGGDATIASSEIYDPVSGSFTLSGSLAASRDTFASAVLADGRVLVIGGGLYPTGISSSVDVWNPTTGTWSSGGTLITPRMQATATVLNNGKVLIAGGYNGSWLSTAEIYDPATGTSTLTGNLTVPHSGHIASKLADGNVVVEGGAGTTGVSDKTIEIYDVASGTWRFASSVSVTRTSAAAEMLPSGGVLYSGGSPGPLTSAEIFNPGCAVTPNRLSPASASFTASGGTGSVNINIPAGCAWRVNMTYVPSFMTITSPTTGVGPGTLTYSIASTTYGRGATPKIADSDFPISQSAPCDASYVPSLSPASQNVGSAAGSNSFWINHSAGCNWSVSGVPSWVTITAGASGQGSGNIYYSYTANTGTARTGTITVAGKTFTLNQSAAGVTCPAGATSSISPSSQSFTSAGGSNSISVYYAAGCAWTVSNVPAWVTITSGASGQGNGTVNYSVAANSGADRSGWMAVDNKQFIINQSGVPATGGSACDAVPLTTGVSTGGSLASTDCHSGARGTGYNTDRYSFTATGGQQIAIQLSSSAFDTYLYLKNPSGTVIASNDDSGGTTNSRIPVSSGYFTLPAGASGTYVIEVTSYSQSATGNYTVLRLQ